MFRSALEITLMIINVALALISIYLTSTNYDAYKKCKKATDEKVAIKAKRDFQVMFGFMVLFALNSAHYTGYL